MSHQHLIADGGDTAPSPVAPEGVARARSAATPTPGSHVEPAGD